MPADEPNAAAVALAKRACESILFAHDHRPGPNASLATGAALRILGRSQGAGAGWIGGHTDREAEVAEIRSAQIEFEFTAEGYEPAGGGGEHLTFFRVERDGLIYKATWRDSFGFVPAFDAKDDLVLREATPSEYLLRCGLANVVFGDAIRLMCIAPDQAGQSEVPSIITSQPFVIGSPAEPDVVRRYLESLDFIPLPQRRDPVTGLHDVWYRAADQVMICDAVAGNFVQSPDGQVAAIDLPAAIVPV